MAATKDLATKLFRILPPSASSVQSGLPAIACRRDHVGKYTTEDGTIIQWISSIPPSVLLAREVEGLPRKADISCPLLEQALHSSFRRVWLQKKHYDSRVLVPRENSGDSIYILDTAETLRRRCDVPRGEQDQQNGGNNDAACPGDAKHKPVPVPPQIPQHVSGCE
jgi:hypothetical protein